MDERRAGRSTSVLPSLAGVVVAAEGGVFDVGDSSGFSGSGVGLGMVMVNVSEGFEMGKRVIRSSRILA